jgi:phospho-N-acetylmuramoyl-pentapeptide-transferase
VILSIKSLFSGKIVVIIDMSEFLLPLLVATAVCSGISALLIRIPVRSFFTKPRPHTPLSHQKKNPTIALGGIAIISGVVVSLLCCVSLSANCIIILSGVCLFGLIGFLDDCVKLRNDIGIFATSKACLQWLAACFIIFLMYFLNPAFFSQSLFYSNTVWFYLSFILWCFLVIIGTVNAVNLTDGLDMLAVSVVVPINGFLVFVAYHQGNDLIALANLALIGSLCGFAYFNKKPAKLWMGDVGSLSIGACIALSALLLRVELFLLVVAIVLVFETISVMMQVFSIKRWQKKIFKMAPIHHHFELSGYTENEIVTGACSISVLASIIGSLLFLAIK